MPRFARVAEGSRVQDESAAIVNTVVNLIQPRGGEIGEHVDEYFVGNLEYWEAVVRPNSNEPHEGEGDITWTCLGYRFNPDSYAFNEPP